MKEAGLIDYARGQLTVTDRRSLEACSCECYELMEAQMDRIFDRPWRELARCEDEQGR